LSFPHLAEQELQRQIQENAQQEHMQRVSHENDQLELSRLEDDMNQNQCSTMEEREESGSSIQYLEKHLELTTREREQLFYVHEKTMGHRSAMEERVNGLAQMKKELEADHRRRTEALEELENV
jgi:hypothetical protein